jgi:tetratricopeptide (TPR) repeat protein
MNLERLKILEDFAKEEPNDPFNLYALALEYLQVDSSKAGQLFDQLLTLHPGYVPTYYQAGNYYWEKGETRKAITILKTGLEKSRTVNDVKAHGELQVLIDLFED